MADTDKCLRMRHQSKRYKWIVFAASYFVTTFVFGLLFAFASLFNEILDTFGESRSKAVAVQAILIGVAQSTGLISGILTHRFGLWKVAAAGATLCSLGLILAFFAASIEHLYVCIGCITGLGVSLLFICSTTAISRSFQGSQRLLVLAINQTGIGVAGIALPYLFDIFLKIYGLKGTFLVLGGIYLNNFPVVGIFIIFETNNIKRKHSLKDIERANLSKHIRKSALAFIEATTKELKLLKTSISNVLSLPYILHLIAVGIMVSSVNAYMSLVFDILNWKGFSQSEALLSFPVVYGVGFVARLLPGLVKQCNGVNSLVLPIVFGLCGCVGQIIIYVSPNKFLVFVGCGLSGISVSGVISAAVIVVVQIAGPEHIAIGFGLITTSIGLLSAAVGPTFGAIRDKTDSYGTVLMLTSGLQLVGTILLISTLISRKHEQKNNRSLDKSKHTLRSESQVQLVHTVSQHSLEYDIVNPTCALET